MVTVLLVLLCCTNLITAAALVRSHRSRSVVPVREISAVLGDGPPPVGTRTHTRRVITVEILNPLELAANRGRVAGIAGSLAPGLVRRMVHDQTLKRLQRELAAQRVAADVRLHTLRPVVIEPAPMGATASAAPPAAYTTAEPAEPAEPAETAGSDADESRADDFAPAAEPVETDQPPSA